MLLYHVSYDLSEPLEKEFIPRIPQNREEGEDNITNRICMSDSIVGCIRGINGYPKTDNEYVDIIVWKHEFSKDDPYIVDWKYIAEQGLVRDAIISHEYWYTKSICMIGQKVRISNLKYEEYYLFSNKYKNKVIEIVSKYIEQSKVIDIDDLNKMDACTIINEWVPKYICLEFQGAINRDVEQALTTYETKIYSEDILQIYRALQHKPDDKESKFDYTKEKILISCDWSYI